MTEIEMRIERYKGWLECADRRTEEHGEKVERWRRWFGDLIDDLDKAGTSDELVDEVTTIVNGLINDLDFSYSIHYGLSRRIGTLVDRMSAMNQCNCVDCERNQ